LVCHRLDWQLLVIAVIVIGGVVDDPGAVFPSPSHLTHVGENKRAAELSPSRPSSDLEADQWLK
jgi:hypothetical protein